MRTTRFLVIALAATVLPAAARAQSSTGSVQSSSVSAPVGRPAQTGVSRAQALYGVAASPARYVAPGRALMIPNPQTTSEQLAAVATDMAIMCRLLEIKLLAPYLASGHVSGLSLPWSDRGGQPSLFASDGDRISSFYAADYGLVFTLTVDFPLRAPAEPNEPARPEDRGDPLWTQVKRQMDGADPTATRMGDAPRLPYDPARVDQFVAALVQTLRHAANIRHMKPNEWITVVVTSTTSDPGASPLAIATNVRTQAPTVPSSATVLTVRAHKADIDAFARDELTAEQFRPRVELAMY